MTGESPKHRRGLWSWVLTATLFLLVALISSIPGVRDWQVRLTDTFFSLAPAPKEKSRVVVIEIDDRSLQEYGRWPWSRELLARLTNNLSQAGAQVIGLDILLAEPQSPSADEALRLVLQSSQRAVLVDKIGAFADGPRWIEPLPDFAKAAVAVGHAHAVLDVDSVCRRFPPRELALEGSRWAFALEVARRVDTRATLKFLNAYSIPISDSSAAVTVAKPVLIPIAYRKEGFDTISASTVRKGLAYRKDRFDTTSAALGGLDPGLVQGRPVLVGFGPTEISDRLSTPLTKEFPEPGVEVHAQILDSILGGRHLKETPLSLNAVILLVTCTLVVVVFRTWRGLAIAGLLLGVGALAFAIALAGFIWGSRILPVGPMLLAVVLGPLLVYAADFVVVERSLTQQLGGLRTWLALRGKNVADAERGDLSWRLETLQSLQTELGSLYELHEALLASTRDLVAIFDESGNLLLSNQSFAAVFRLESRFTLEQLQSRIHQKENSGAQRVSGRAEGEVTIDQELYSYRFVPLPPTTLAPGGGTIVTLTNLRTRVERDRARAEALGFITHELRTPLASIQGFAELLMHYPASPLSQGAPETIFRESKRLLALISSYLYVLRLDAGAKPLNTQVIDLDEVVHQVFEILAPLATAARMRLLADRQESVIIKGDTPLISGALLNLVSNAIKYGEPGTDIRVSWVRHQSEVVIGVHNKGQGIAPDEIPHLFDSYYRGARIETGKPGWGLGLAFVKRIAEKHGGEVKVHSDVTGTLFEVHLPAPSESAVPAKEII